MKLVLVMSTGAGPPDCRQTTCAVSGLGVLKAMMSSENCPFDCRASTAPNVPQQSASCVPTHLTQRLIVPAVAALSPPPPGICTHWDSAPLKASAPPASPFRSVAPATAPTKVPSTPRLAAAFPLKGQ